MSISMPEDAGALPTPMARRRELLLAGLALIGILLIGAGTWAATPPMEFGGAPAAGDALSPILDGIQWALSTR